MEESMITRAYQNARGERQEVTLEQSVWETLTEEELNRMLGFGSPEPKPAPTPKPATPARRKRR